MGTITIQEFTTKYPITMIGQEAGVCWGKNTEDNLANYKRGIDCLECNHGRTFEFPDIYMVLDGYSARVIREWYTHIGGSPTRLQASTRYIDYEHGFDYVTPQKIKEDPAANLTFISVMNAIKNGMVALEELGMPREDTAMMLPLGMTTKVVCKHNLRNIMDMSRQRKCTRAYHEYRKIMDDLCAALSEYSEEWAHIAANYLKPKCEATGFCTEKRSCGRKPTREYSDGK